MPHSRILLGVNIDHIATMRQARGTPYPEPVHAALEAEQAGADSITLHLREDRRHIQEYDVERLRGVLQTRMNLEMAVTEPMLRFAEKIAPQDVCLVPERREELTTEGGLDVLGQLARITAACVQLGAAGCRTSLFVDPDLRQIDAAAQAGAPVIEIHTGHYAQARDSAERHAQWRRIDEAVTHGKKLGLKVHAGHGLHYHNVTAIAQIAGIRELNIGHAIIARALFTGLQAAVGEMKRLMCEARAA